MRDPGSVSEIEKMTVLTIASSRGLNDILAEMRVQGEHFRSVSVAGATLAAVKKKHWSTVLTIAEMEFANPNIPGPRCTEYGDFGSIFFQACFNDRSIGQKLFHIGAADPQFYANNTPEDKIHLTRAVSLLGVDALHTFLAQGFDINTPEEDIKTADPYIFITLAKSPLFKESAEALISCGADINHIAPLFLILSERCKESSRFLVERGAWLPSHVIKDIKQGMDDFEQEQKCQLEARRVEERLSGKRQKIEQGEEPDEDDDFVACESLAHREISVSLWREVLHWRGEYLSGLSAALQAGHPHCIPALAGMIAENLDLSFGECASGLGAAHATESEDTYVSDSERETHLSDKTGNT